MSILLLALAFRCNPPILNGNIPDRIIRRAAEVCLKKYNGCTVSITETGDQDYRVICRRWPVNTSHITMED